MLKEVTNSFKATLYQRINSPLYGTYFFSWILYNWAIVIPLILGDKKFDVRWTTFKKSVLNLEGEFNNLTVLIPLIISAVILLLHPFFQRYLFIYTEWNKSKGLQKRDEFTSQTMLTLEQSNEMRNSIQKIHTFHQEALKHKDEEITEYKSLIESKQTQIDRLSSEKIELIENNSALQSNESKYTSDIASKNNKIELLDLRYDRLSNIFKKQRERKFYLLRKINGTGWYANDQLIHEFSKLLNSSSSLSETESIVNNMLSLSGDKGWSSACYKLMVGKFIDSGSFDEADINFDALIKPNLEKLDLNLLYLLVNNMGKKSQLADRRRAAIDLKLVSGILTLKQS